ncbi:MAG: acetylglutamate kinase [Actinomycetota bacterium]
MMTGHGVPSAVKSLIASSMGKARILMEALPYIKAFRGKTVVIKYGGAAMDDASLAASFAGDVTLLAMVGIRPVIVHGGGPQITAALTAEGVTTRFVDGRRVTDSVTMRIVQKVLAGEINPDIVNLLNRHGCPAVGLTGLDAGLFSVVAKDPRLGFVGEVAAVNAGLMGDLIDDGLVPVIAPLGTGENGRVYNLNADTAAAALARELEAQKLVYLTDVEGVRRDLADPDSLMSRMTLAELGALLSGPSIEGGMRPKLESCLEALTGGVAQAHILDGRIQHALLLEIFTPEGIGTMVLP